VSSRPAVLLLAALLLAPGVAGAQAVRVLSARVVAPNELRLRFSAPLPRSDAENFRLTTVQEPDIPIPVRRVRSGAGNRVVLTFGQRLLPAEHYRLELAARPLTRYVRPSTGPCFSR
jgi:hypothetical protein